MGPAVAGLLIATVGVGWCFVANSASFVAVIASLVGMDRSRLQPSAQAPREKGQLRAGLDYVRRTPQLLVPLLMMGLVGMLTYEFQVTLPVVARRVLHGGAETYGLLTAAMGVGAVAGALYIAARGRTGLRALVTTVVAFAAAVFLAALAPDTGSELAALALVGFAGVAFVSTGNATLQLGAEPAMRGRVMALWSVAFLGSTPIGGPVIGWITGLAGARTGLMVGAGACAAAAALGSAVTRWRKAPKPGEKAVAVADAEVPALGVLPGLDAGPSTKAAGAA